MAGGPKLAAVVAIVFCLTGHCYGAQQYLGKFLGKLSELHHGVTGEVYAVDARTLHIKDFTYDGEGPAAYFWAGTTRSPGNAGFRVRDEDGNGAVLKRYRRKSITLTLPDGKTLNNIKWFSVWCEEFAVNFGDVKIPRNFDYPKPQKIDGLHGVHGVSSDNVVIVDAQTLLIPNFSYDGEAPDAKFWVGRGPKPGSQGIRVPDENGKEIPLRRYDRKTVVLTLPGELTVFDVGHFGVWCEAFAVDFGHVRVPQTLNVPPSLKMLGVSPQSKLNCEVLFDDLAFEVRWAVAGESIVLQLVAKLDNGEYMSFGLSGDNSKTEMIGGDVVVAWVDKETLKGYAEDYFLEAKSQCSGPSGSCPDERLAANTNNIRLLNAAMVNGYSIVTYQRPLKPSDELDRQILTNQSQAIIWAVGPLNQRNEVSFHSHYTKKDHRIDFGRPAKWNCPMPEADSSPAPTAQQVTPQRRKPEPVPEVVAVEVTTRGRATERRRGGNREVSDRRRDNPPRQVQEDRSTPRRRGSSSRYSDRNTAITTTTTTERVTQRPVPTPKAVSYRNAWHIPPIECYEPDDGVFYAQMGPTGGKRGYPAITGHVGWGISWYINGLLIPEINVVRGKTYTFITEGGDDPEVPAKFHPFYITDDPVGGYEHKTPEEKQAVRIFAGVKQTRDGNVSPTGVGRLCHWTHTGDKDADEFQSFGGFQRTLELRCDVGEPGVITWTPDANTPDTVYYQCFTHRYLGWKINVVDTCDEPAASEPEPAFALPPPDNGDLKPSPSIIVETRITPNDLFQTTLTKQTPDRHPDEPNQSYDPLPPANHSTTPASATANVTTPTPVKNNPFPTGRHPLKQAKLPMRRPLTPNRPPFAIKPMLLSMHRPPPVQGPYKKSFYRIPLRKRPAIRPTAHKIARPKPAVANQEPIMIMKYQQIPLKLNKLKNEIVVVASSTQSPVTSKEIDSASESAFSSQLISVKEIQEKHSTMRPAVNTGFHPESVVIESGFKPIITQKFQERISDNDSDYFDQQEDIGVINLNSENAENSQQYTESFEPIFIPSPPDSHLLLSKKQNMTKYSKRNPIVKKNPSLMFIVKHVARSADLDDEVEEEEDDKIAMAAERVEAYYLPPDDRKSKPIDKIRKPSNIDIPPGTVVTFDGKTVSGVSLTAPVLEAGVYEARSSKAAELLRLSPQFGPFRGEIPPLDQQSINVANLPQLSSQAVINRGLNAPAPAPAAGTTRLAPVRSASGRRRRAAHHTPEHTAEQARQGQSQGHSHHEHTQHNETGHNSNSSTSTHLSNCSLLHVIAFCFVFKYFNF